jgi:Fe(3+) dicitrate transport protein
MKKRLFGGALALGVAMFAPGEAFTQTAEDESATEGAASSASQQPAADGPPEGEVPAVEVIQPRQEPQPEPTPAVEATPEPRPRPAPRPVVSAPPAPPPPVADLPPIEPELVLPNMITQPPPGYYGPPGGEAAYERALDSPQSPINPVSGIAPADLQDFSSAASRVTRQQINEQDPLTTNDILTRVPGVNIVADDGLARHGGIGVRGSPPRRSRKVLVMEDGRPINMSLWLDPSTHYTPPPERLEAVEVVRGSVIYGPNNNFGAINFRNFQPFGPNETVVSGEGGSVSLDGPGLNDDGSAAKWHVHTRQTAGNWGTVMSYTGANAQGAWDSERLRYNDFYAALGWKGVRSDATVSAVYFRQRDNYDEGNLEFEEEEEDGDEEGGDLAEDDELEEEEETSFRSDSVEEAFFKEIGHCKTCYNPGSIYNTYNADVVLLQGVYNYYFDPDTTLNYRIYGQHHRRDRYQNFEGANPNDAEDDFSALFVGDDIVIPEGVMLGRLRTYNFVGTALQTEFANRPFAFGLTQDIQVGARYEHHDFTNANFFGRQGQILEDGDKKGAYVFDVDTQADAWSFFLQSSIPVTQALSIVPGARLDHYRISRDIRVGSEEEGEGEELEECEIGGREFFEGEECAVFEVDRDPLSEAFTETHVLPGIGFSWGLLGKRSVPMGKSLEAPETTYHTTMYGGYNRGLTMNVLRETGVRFPPPSELGDNYQIGIRSTGIKGVTLDVAGFYKLIENFQVKGASTDAAGNNVYTNIDQVEIPGLEMYARLDTRPYIGGNLNPFLEGTFTYNDGTITEGVDSDGISLVGNLIPEVSQEVAYLTAGIESVKGWNASVSWVYRGGFFTDEQNTPYGGDFSGENGFVPSVWLLNARANYTVPQNLLPNADLAFYVSGQNLTDELYITDREDGVKPGLGRTLMAGARIKW